MEISIGVGSNNPYLATTLVISDSECHEVRYQGTLEANSEYRTGIRRGVYNVWAHGNNYCY